MAEAGESRAARRRRARDARLVSDESGPLSGWALAAGCTAVVALAIKLLIAGRTYGTNDVLYWEYFVATLHRAGGLGLYHQVGIFNHPPFMIHALGALDALASLSGGPFRFWLRVPAIFADLGSVVLVWKLLQPWRRAATHPAALMLLAAAPASVMISGFHGNTDPVMVFFVLLSVFLWERRRQPWAAGLALGMAMNIKVVPVIFLPVIWFAIADRRARLAYLAAAGAAVLVGSLPYLLQDPVFIIRRVLGYGSLYGHWGLSRLTGFLPPAWLVLDQAYARFGKYLVLGVIAVVCAWMNRGRYTPPFFLQYGIVAFLFLALTPGFGVQYLAWLVPWAVGAGFAWAALYYAASGLFLFLVYNFWAQSFPWYLANSDRVGDWRGAVIGFELACWVSVVVVLACLLKRVARARTGGEAPA
ncbi:MAG: glycosyltransferase 87 family protein [Nitrospiria bacterium]